jgi:hypothetical protein
MKLLSVIVDHPSTRVARWYIYLRTKNPYLGKFWRAVWNGNCWYFEGHLNILLLLIRIHILWPFGIPILQFFGLLVYFAIFCPFGIFCYIFCPFGIFWYIFWPFGIFWYIFGHLVYIFWYIFGHLVYFSIFYGRFVYFMAIRNIL